MFIIGKHLALKIIIQLKDGKKAILLLQEESNVMNVKANNLINNPSIYGENLGR